MHRADARRARLLSQLARSSGVRDSPHFLRLVLNRKTESQRVPTIVCDCECQVSIRLFVLRRVRAILLARCQMIPGLCAAKEQEVRILLFDKMRSIRRAPSI